MHVRFSDTVLSTQRNRLICRDTTNLFWLGNPSEHPELAAVLKAMGLTTDKPVLHAEHPVLLAFNKEAPGNAFVLAPRKTTQKSSVLYGQDPVFQQFLGMLGVSIVASRAKERPS